MLSMVNIYGLFVILNFFLERNDRFNGYFILIEWIFKEYFGNFYILF